LPETLGSNEALLRLSAQTAYHRLCAVLCVKAARALLGASAAAAAAQLEALHPASRSTAEHAHGGGEEGGVAGQSEAAATGAFPG
jgi:hypothetical protein